MTVVFVVGINVSSSDESDENEDEDELDAEKESDESLSNKRNLGRRATLDFLLFPLFLFPPLIPLLLWLIAIGLDGGVIVGGVIVGDGVAP